MRPALRSAPSERPRRASAPVRRRLRADDRHRERGDHAVLDLSLQPVLDLRHRGQPDRRAAFRGLDHAARHARPSAHPVRPGGPLLRADGAGHRDHHRGRGVRRRPARARPSTSRNRRSRPWSRRWPAGSGCASGARRGEGSAYRASPRRGAGRAGPGGPIFWSMRAARSSPCASPTAGWRSRPGSATAGSRTAGCAAPGQNRRRLGRR